MEIFTTVTTFMGYVRNTIEWSMNCTGMYLHPYSPYSVHLIPRNHIVQVSIRVKSKLGCPTLQSGNRLHE